MGSNSLRWHLVLGLLLFVTAHAGCGGGDGDGDGDGDVDGLDYYAFLYAMYGYTDPATAWGFDADSDGDVDYSDYYEFYARYGTIL